MSAPKRVSAVNLPEREAHPQRRIAQAGKAVAFTGGVHRPVIGEEIGLGLDDRSFGFCGERFDIAFV